MIIGTVVTNSHISRAKVLAQSIKFHHPEIKVVVSLVERSIDPDTASFPCFDEVVLAKDTWQGNFDRVLFKYDTWEACCFAKGPLMGYLFERYPEENYVLFLDSDTEVLAPLYDLMDRFARSSVLLTPQHLSKGAEYDDFKYGLFNAGVIGASRTKDGLAFVKWWTKRLERHSYFDENDKLFAEQKWLNLVPSFFNQVELIRHPGYNVAAWNFYEREVNRTEDGRYEVNGAPLYIFHFHAIGDREREANNPDYAARHPVLSELIKEYALLLDTMGRYRTSMIPWSYSFFTSGERIERQSRLVYRNNRYLEELYPNPFLLSNSILANVNEQDRITKPKELPPVWQPSIPFTPTLPVRRKRQRTRLTRVARKITKHTVRRKKKLCTLRKPNKCTKRTKSTKCKKPKKSTKRAQRTTCKNKTKCTNKPKCTKKTKCSIKTKFTHKTKHRKLTSILQKHRRKDGKPIRINRILRVKRSLSRTTRLSRLFINVAVRPTYKYRKVS